MPLFLQAVEAAMVEDGLVKKGKLPKPYPPVSFRTLSRHRGLLSDAAQLSSCRAEKPWPVNA